MLKQSSLRPNFLYYQYTNCAPITCVVLSRLLKVDVCIIERQSAFLHSINLSKSRGTTKYRVFFTKKIELIEQKIAPTLIR